MYFLATSIIPVELFSGGKPKKLNDCVLGKQTVGAKVHWSKGFQSRALA